MLLQCSSYHTYANRSSTAIARSTSLHKSLVTTGTFESKVFSINYKSVGRSLLNYGFSYFFVILAPIWVLLFREGGNVFACITCIKNSACFSMQVIISVLWVRDCFRKVRSHSEEILQSHGLLTKPKSSLPPNYWNVAPSDPSLCFSAVL